ncbi:MAG: RDD family protein [Gallionellaceae bacterium]|nr:RDD family protein [Gallionellaceae bacterium]
MQTAPLTRRLACLFYDALLLLAVLFVAGFVVVGLLPDVSAGLPRLLYQGWLLLVAGVYFTWSWRRGGQTLAMKTWRIRLITEAGAGVGLGRAWLRYGLAILGLIAFGIGFLWALWDADRQFLHDRLAGTRLVMAVA